MRTTTDMIAALGTDGVYTQHGAASCRTCGTWAEPFWRVQGTGEGEVERTARSVSFPAVDSVDKAHAMLWDCQQREPTLTAWEIVKFTPVIQLTVEPCPNPADPEGCYCPGDGPCLNAKED